MPEMMCMTEDVEASEGGSTAEPYASESGCQTESGVRGTENLDHLVSEKEATELYARFKKENAESKVTLQQFWQILALRRRELQPKDTSHIKIDEGVMHKPAQQAEKEAKEERQRIKTLDAQRRQEQDKKLAKFLARLHQRLPEKEGNELRVAIQTAMKDREEQEPMLALANLCVKMCRLGMAPEKDREDDEEDEGEAEDEGDEEGAELEAELRTLFGELMSGGGYWEEEEQRGRGLPRRVWGRMMLKRGQQAKQARAEQGRLGEVEEGEGEEGEGEGDGGGGREQGPVGAGMTAEQARLVSMIPAEKMEKFQRHVTL